MRRIVTPHIAHKIIALASGGGIDFLIISLLLFQLPDPGTLDGLVEDLDAKLKSGQVHLPLILEQKVQVM